MSDLPAEPDELLLTPEEQMHRLAQYEQRARVQTMLLEVRLLQAVSLYNDPATYGAANDAIAFLYGKKIAIAVERSEALDDIAAVRV